MESIDRSSNRPWEFCSINTFTTDPATHNHTLQIHIPSRFPGEWAYLAHVSVMKYHILYFTPIQSQVNCTWSHSTFFGDVLQCGSDCPLYEVAASESSSYLIWLLQWECYRFFAWLLSRDQLSVNTKTVHFWKILLAQAERAYQN